MIEYLVGPAEYLEEINDWSLVFRRVTAGTPGEAVTIYKQALYPCDEFLREFILSKSIANGFAGNFWLLTDEDEEVFNRTGEVLASIQEFKDRVLDAFEDRPDLGEAYIAYVFSQTDSPFDARLFNDFVAYLIENDEVLRWVNVIAIPTEQIVKIEPIDLGSKPLYAHNQTIH